MKTLITAADVIASAFAEGEYIPEASVTEADIASAEHRYIEPVAGRALMDALAEGRYAALLADYVKPALAMSVRESLQRALNVRTGAHGLSVAGSGAAYTVARTAADGLQASLRIRARALRRLLSDRLAAIAAGVVAGESVPEYDPESDAMQKCSVDGGFVQIL